MTDYQIDSMVTIKGEEYVRLKAQAAAWQGIHEGAVAAMQADIKRLRSVLERHVCDCKSNCAWERDEICPSWEARAALEGK